MGFAILHFEYASERGNGFTTVRFSEKCGKPFENTKIAQIHNKLISLLRTGLDQHIFIFPKQTGQTFLNICVTRSHASFSSYFPVEIHQKFVYARLQTGLNY